MIFYILIIAVLNLGVGFAVAAYIGRQYREMVATHDPWDFDQTEEPPGDSETESPVDETPVDEAPVEDPAAETSLDEGLSEAEDDEVSPEEASEDASETEEPQQEDTKETCVEGLCNEIGRYRDQVREAEADLRAGAGPLEPVAIEQILSSLREATEEFVTTRNTRLGQFEQLGQSTPRLADIHERVQATARKQDEQIAGVNEAADSLDHENEPAEGRRRLIEATHELLTVNNRMRDELDDAMLEMVRADQRLDDLDETARFDPLTNLLNRVGLELAFEELRKENPEGSREVCAVLVDLDRFGPTNESHGQTVGDRILAAMAQSIRSEDLGEGPIAARVAGQEFLLVLPDAEPRTATNAAERVRQAIEAMQFEHHDEEFTVTVSCGVAMVETDDTTDALLDKIRATVQEAKRYGRNRTFLQEGEHATPVVPPNLSLPEKPIPL